MFFYKPHGDKKQERFLFFYLPLVIVITKKTQSLMCEI